MKEEKIVLEKDIGNLDVSIEKLRLQEEQLEGFVADLKAKLNKK